MAGKENPFSRSGKTIRSPPQAVPAISMSESLVADTSKRSCQLCQEFDNVDMVECSNCQEWFHFVCVGVNRDIENKDWWCNKCSTKKCSKKSVDGNADKKSAKSSRSSKTLTSHASSAAKKKLLALERIEEEKALREAREKEYLDKKYEALEKLISSDEDDDPESLDDENLSENAKRYTSQWVDDQIDRTNEMGEEINQIEISDGRKMLTSTESNIEFSPESCLYNKNQLDPLDEKIEKLRFERTRRDVQVSIAPTQVSNVVGQSSDLVKFNEEGLVSVVKISNHPPASINQSLATGQMNMGVVSKPSFTSQNANSATRQPSVSQTKNMRETTYSVFTKQVPIINSSVVGSESNMGFFNQKPTAEGQAHFAQSDSGQTLPIRTSNVGSQSGDPNQQSLISWNGGKPSNTIVIPRPSFQNSPHVGKEQLQPSFIAGQSISNPNFIGAQSISNPSFIAGQSISNPSFIGGQSISNPSFIGGQSISNPSFIGSQSISNPNFIGSQPFLNPTSVGGQSISNPSFIAGQSISNPSFIGGQSISNPSFIAGQSISNPSFIGGQSISNPSFIAGQSISNPSFIGGQSSSNPSFIAGQSISNPSFIGGQSISNPSFIAGQSISNPNFIGAQSISNPSFIAGQSISNPSFIGGQSISNPSFIGSQSISNPNFIGSQPFLNPTSVGGQSISNPSFLGGQPYSSNAGGQLNLNPSFASGQLNPNSTVVGGFSNSSNVGNLTIASRTRLDANQIAARQAMPKNLPLFYGTPEEWPLFFSAYENSTNACGYSNSENLGRLTECLKGDAKDAVRCILLHPDSVPEIMETLKMLFGRPELVIDTLLEDLQKEPSPKENDLNALIKFALRVRNLVATIRNYGPLDHMQNPLLIKVLVDKLPTQTRINWAYFKHSNPNANLANFGDWLYSLAQVTSQVVGRQKCDSSKKDRKDNQKSQNSRSNHINAHMDSSSINQSSDTNQKNQSHRQCPICSLESCKQIQECDKFRSLTSAERWNAIKGKKICYSCFGKHRHFKCRFRKKCQVSECQSTHHILLHDNEKQVSPNNKQNSNSSTGRKSKSEKMSDASSTSTGTIAKTCNSLQTKQGPAMFRIVPVILYAKKKLIQTFAYLDDGSNLTLVERELANDLGLTGIPDILNVRWAFKNSDERTDSEIVSLRISGDFKSAPNYKINDVFTVDELFLPSQTITKDWLKSYSHLKGLPISTYKDATPRILIGLHSSKLIVSQETVEGKWNEPVACRTRLGWVVQGPDENKNSEPICNTKVSLNMCESHSDNQLHQLVKEFFSFESFGTRVSEKILESKETARAREILDSTTVKKDGRFETGLLWRYDDVYLPDSYGMALKRLNCLENKMKKDPSLANKLCDQIEDFVGKKYIRKLLPHEIEQGNSRTWYLPIFVVYNPKKPLKFRTVWDAAAKVKNVSLNSVLLKGPDQLVPLPDVLRRFRERLYAVTGDIGEMFHRVGVIKEDRCAQRFLWRDGRSDRKPDVYAMEVLTFGSACSPSSAQYVKNKNALDFKNQLPRAVEAIVDNTYIDDMLDCEHTIDEACRLLQDIKYIHKQASFEFGKFTSNSTEILQTLGEEDNPQVKNLNLSSEVTTERVLGMFWNTFTDMFTYSLKYARIDEVVMTGNRNPTKREVLRALMSIFDPLGLIANVLVYAKILLQEIWRKSTDWDEQITGSLQDNWLAWIRILPQVEQLEIPRLYSPKLSPQCPKSIQIHIFVDASLEACAAVAYFRFEDEFGVYCALVGAKTKVAPNKPLTVPRLELQAAVLGTRLAKSVGKSQRFKIDKRYYWSDSQTVLSWIMSEKRKYNQFVAFRVGEILENSAEDEWNWVNTNDNVADEATKSRNKPDISSSSRWFKGPSFLYESEDEWNRFVDKEKYTTDEELRPRYLLAQFTNKCESIINPNKFSSWQKLRRTLAFVLRFTDNLKIGKKNRITGPLSRMEYIRAENQLYQQAQKDNFADEITIIRHNNISPIENRKDLDKASLLKTCSPYIDDFGVLRIKGRIDAAKHLSDQTKRPIILPRDHRITKLIIDDYHRKYHHMNHQTTLNELHQKYFIPSLRRGLKSVIQNICQRCKNDRANPKVPEMADLPPARVATFTRPYTYVGIDYFGPYVVKVNTTKRKRWGVLITCLTTRAIHIEVAEALTTSECIMAIRRFNGRRGTPTEYYSDNGTNFHGSERELRTEFEKLNFAEIEETFTDSVSQWRFNPPLAAHMGGSWERMIRTVKSILKKSMPTRTPTEKMFETYLVEAEYIINSRPLTYVHLDHLEDEILTPNHFLLGSSGGVRAPGNFDETHLLKDDWKAVQHMTDLFWRRFNVEYLPTLTRRTKWFKEVKPIEVGDLVIIVDDKHERNTWPKGVVEEVFPGRGNRVRQARVRLIRGRDNLAKIDVKKIKHQSLVRPVAKLAVLDVAGVGKDKLSSSREAVNGRENVEESHSAGHNDDLSD